MNILGIGGWELVAILLIMLLVAGPKRMVHWAYILGQYVARFRAMWAETVDIVQKEFDDAGVGIQIPREPPTRASLNRQASKAFESITRPVQETMNEATSQVNHIKQATALTASAASGRNGHSTAGKKPHPPRPDAASSRLQPKSDHTGEFGTWSGQGSGGAAGDFGTWSAGDTPADDSAEG